MKIAIDKESGFCFGVVYAIRMAEDELEQSEKLYCLGDIVHNDQEVERLSGKGLRIITHDELRSLRDCKVLIRAHGEPPETYRIALANNIELLDASCPVVLKLQNRVKNTFNNTEEESTQIVIYGKPGHAEVNGLIGQTLSAGIHGPEASDRAIIIRGEEDLDLIDYTKPIVLFSQTTQSTDMFYRIKSMIEERAAAAGNTDVCANDTICRQVSNREPQLMEFAGSHDVVIFVSGKKSSNGKVLYGVCRSVNSRSYFITHEDELRDDWFRNCASVGICGATSTPMWQMQKVAECLEKRFMS